MSDCILGKHSICLCVGALLMLSEYLHGESWEPVPMCAVSGDELWRFSMDRNAWMVWEHDAQWREVYTNPFLRTEFPCRFFGEHLWWVWTLELSPPLSLCRSPWKTNEKRVEPKISISYGMRVRTEVENKQKQDEVLLAEFAEEIRGSEAFFRQISGLSMIEWPLNDHRGDSYNRLIKTMIRHGTPRNLGETRPYLTPFDFVPLPNDQIQVYVLQPPLIGVWHGKMTHKQATRKLGEKTISSPSIAVHWKLVRTYQAPFAESFHVVTDGDKDLFVVPKHGIFSVRDATGAQPPKLEVITSLTHDNDGHALGDFTTIASDLDNQRTYIIVAQHYLEINNLQIAEQWTNLDQAPRLVRACCIPPDEDK